jgi:hypothetical protein
MNANSIINNQPSAGQQVKSGLRLSFLGLFSLITYGFLYQTVSAIVDVVRHGRSDGFHRLYVDLIVKPHLFHEHSLNLWGAFVLVILLFIFSFVLLWFLLPLISNLLALRLSKGAIGRLARLNRKVLLVTLVLNIVAVALFLITSFI